tara:strand:+ start:7165 stop:7476 length:312 start_codon:yes stop_codon:yes gene_type:complete
MEFIGCLLLALGGLGMIISLSIIHGWVLTYLWAWFVVPIFSVPELTIAQAMGLSLIIGMWTYNPQATQQQEDEDKYKALARFVAICLRPFIVLFIGYIIKQFV